MTSQDAILMVLERNAFYRRQYFLALGIFALSLVVMGVLSWMLVFVIRNPVHPLYFATDKVGRLIQVIPTNQPNMSQTDVANWAIRAVESAYSYDYVNYRSQLQATQKYFTAYGWDKYMSALEASNNLVALKQRRMIVTAKIVAPPVLLTQGILSGAYAWKFHLPLLVTYWLPPFDETSRFSNAIDVTVIVQRQPILQSDRGLGILQMIGSATTALPPEAGGMTNPQST